MSEGIGHKTLQFHGVFRLALVIPLMPNNAFGLALVAGMHAHSKVVLF